MNRRILSLLPLLATLIPLALLSACGTARSHRLPVSATEARSTFAPIASCADGQGLRYVEHPDSVHVKMDDTTWIQYMIQNQQYNMVIIVDDKKVQGPDLEAKFTAAKAKGDELWACARGHMDTQAPASAPAPAVTPAPAPEETPPPAVVPDTTCGKLLQCYADIAKTLCTRSGDVNCKASFKIEGNPGEEDCQEMLEMVPTLVQPYKMVIPDYEIPATCR